MAMRTARKRRGFGFNTQQSNSKRNTERQPFYQALQVEGKLTNAMTEFETVSCEKCKYNCKSNGWCKLHDIASWGVIDPEAEWEEGFFRACADYEAQ